MAVTITQTPTTPNAAYTNLVYVMSGSNATQPQYRYVVDVYYSGSSDRLTRIKTYPNSTYNGIIDVSRELQDYLDYDQYWTITGSLDPVESVKTFDLKFGEEYGTSLSSSRTIYTGSTSNYLELFPGRVFKNSGGYSFPISDYTGSGSSIFSNDPATVTTTAGPPTGSIFLDNSADYRTVTLYSDTAGTPNSIDIRYGYMQTGSKGGETILNITNPTTVNFTSFGIGPKNLAEYDSTFSSSLAAGTVNYYYTTDDPGGFVTYINDLWDGVPANVNTNFPYNVYKSCGSNSPYRFNSLNEYTRFSWINQYGFWDYYNVYNALKQTTDISRSFYHRPFVRYADSLSGYDVSYRGNKQYKTDYQDTFEIQTDYITKEYADWLTELFESPEVYVQGFIPHDKDSPVSYPYYVPINILNTSVQWQLKDNREKLFQYTIRFKYANDRQSR